MAICLVPGCPNIVERGRCDAHAKDVRQHQRRHHSGIPGVNYGRRWRQHVRPRVWAKDPHCADCGRLLRLCEAEIEHETSHEGDYDLFWDETNMRVRCKPCHSAKTAREVGFAQAQTGGAVEKFGDASTGGRARIGKPSLRVGESS